MTPWSRGAQGHNSDPRPRRWIDGQSNYRAGLRVVSMAERENPVGAVFFDSTPDDANEPEFDDSGSDYPLFASGVVALTSMELKSVSGGVSFVRLYDR